MRSEQTSLPTADPQFEEPRPRNHVYIEPSRKSDDDADKVLVSARINQSPNAILVNEIGTRRI